MNLENTHFYYSFGMDSISHHTTVLAYFSFDPLSITPSAVNLGLLTDLCFFLYLFFTAKKVM